MGLGATATLGLVKGRGQKVNGEAQGHALLVVAHGHPVLEQELARSLLRDAQLFGGGPVSDAVFVHPLLEAHTPGQDCGRCHGG